MRLMFEELGRDQTAMGEISLRRRIEPTLQIDVYEAKLDDEFLMSTLFTVAEIALADLGLARTTGSELDVVVGGLGLGYTAQAALADERVRSVAVVEALGEVIAWHERQLLPTSAQLVADHRVKLVQGDFFAMVAGDGFGPEVPASVHAVLLDVDHSPRWLLHPSHAGFYEVDGLGRLGRLLHPGGVFALWSDAPPDDDYLGVLGQVFSDVEAHVVPFANHYTGGESTNTVYVATSATSAASS